MGLQQAFKRTGGAESILGMDFRDLMDYRVKRNQCYLSKSLMNLIGRYPWHTGTEARKVLNNLRGNGWLTDETIDEGLKVLSELEMAYYPIHKYQLQQLTMTGALSAYRAHFKGLKNVFR